MKEQNYMKYLESHNEELLAIYIDLFNACINNNEVAALEILESDNAIYLDYNIGGDDESTAFMIACYKKMIRVIDKFIDIFFFIYNTSYDKNASFDLNKQNNRGNTALMAICSNGLEYQVKDMLKFRTLNVNLQNNSGETAIMLACKSNNKECIKILLSFPDIDITLKKTDGTDMFNYISTKNLLSLKYLIIPLVEKQYYDKYYNTIYNTLKKTNLDTNKINRISRVTKLNEIKELISRNKLNKLEDILPHSLYSSFPHLFSNLKNKMELDKYSLLFNTNKLKLKDFFLQTGNNESAKYFLETRKLKLKLNENYKYSMQNLINKINSILEKMSTIPNESWNKVKMIRIIYNIALKYSIKDIKRKIEKKYSRIVDNLKKHWYNFLFSMSPLPEP